MDSFLKRFVHICKFYSCRLVVLVVIIHTPLRDNRWATHVKGTHLICGQRRPWSAYRISAYCSICRRTENAQIRLGTLIWIYVVCKMYKGPFRTLRNIWAAIWEYYMTCGLSGSAPDPHSLTSFHFSLKMPLAANAMIRLCGCSGWSESSLGARHKVRSLIGPCGEKMDLCCTFGQEKPGVDSVFTPSGQRVFFIFTFTGDF